MPPKKAPSVGNQSATGIRLRDRTNSKKENDRDKLITDHALRISFLEEGVQGPNAPPPKNAEAEVKNDDVVPSVVYGTLVHDTYWWTIVFTAVATSFLVCVNWCFAATTKMWLMDFVVWHLLPFALTAYNACILHMKTFTKWNRVCLMKGSNWTAGNMWLWQNITPILVTLLAISVWCRLAPGLPLSQWGLQAAFVSTAETAADVLRTMGCNGRFVPASGPNGSQSLVLWILAVGVMWYLAVWRTRDHDHFPLEPQKGFRSSDEGEKGASGWSTGSKDTWATGLAQLHALYAINFIKIGVMSLVLLIVVFEPFALPPFKSVAWTDQPQWFGMIGMSVRNLPINAWTFKPKVRMRISGWMDTDGKISYNQMITGMDLRAGQTNPTFTTRSVHPGVNCMHPVVRKCDMCLQAFKGMDAAQATAEETNGYCKSTAVVGPESMPNATTQRIDQTQKIYEAQLKWEPKRLHRLAGCASMFLLLLSIIETVNMHHEPCRDSCVSHDQKEGETIAKLIGFVLSLFGVFMIHTQVVGPLNPTIRTGAWDKVYRFLGTVITVILVLILVMCRYRRTVLGKIQAGLKKQFSLAENTATVWIVGIVANILYGLFCFVAVCFAMCLAQAVYYDYREQSTNPIDMEISMAGWLPPNMVEIAMYMMNHGT